MRTVTIETAPGLLRDPGSFRDPSGFVYRRDDVLYRQVAQSFGDRWDDLVQSGLLASLQAQGLLVGHDIVSLDLAFDPERAHAVLQPEPIEFISYPYEWSFSELQDAALLTLDAQAAATAAGFTLRDATAYNVQFHNGRPILIDTLSFERATPGAPWIAYRQFCEHFLAPLALMAYRDVRCGMLLRDHLDGIPLDLAARLLPGRTRLNLGLGSHVHAHARAQRHFEARTDVGAPTSRPVLSPLKQAAFLDSLRRTIQGLRWEPKGTEWADYADNTSYGCAAAGDKDAIVHRLVQAAGGRVVWDLGANTGRFSRIAAELGRRVIAWDIDPAATESNYRAIRRDQTTSILPLLGDLANPSPALGWSLAERRSLSDRANADVLLALALVHHLAIGRNIPLVQLAEFLAELGPNLIIEFVPREDSMVQRLLATREDVFPEYTIEGFRSAFLRRFEVREEMPIKETRRTLIWLTRRG
jgi:ribosomal protein L11 methylase PrmA